MISITSNLFVGVREGVYINIVYIVMNPITSNLFVGVRVGVYINIKQQAIP